MARKAAAGECGDEDAKLRDELERKRLARIFGRGLAAPAGSVLPLRRVIQDGARRWQSGKWFFRDDVMFLIPGDSPMGLRLPLESLARDWSTCFGWHDSCHDNLSYLSRTVPCQLVNLQGRYLKTRASDLAAG